MGYHCDQDVHVVILASKEAKVRSIMRTLDRRGKKEGSGGSWQGGKQTGRWWAWVANGFSKKATVEEMFGAWGYECKQVIDPKTKAKAFVLNGCLSEKLGQEEMLWLAMAPVVQDGSYIDLRGEDDAMWRWCFEKGKMLEKQAKVTYE